MVNSNRRGSDNVAESPEIEINDPYNVTFFWYVSLPHDLPVYLGSVSRCRMVVIRQRVIVSIFEPRV